MRVKCAAGVAALIATSAVWVGVTAFTAPAQAEPTVAPRAAVSEHGPGFNCATMGNHICGPGNPEGIPAGCYEDLQDEGTLVVAWTRYDEPHADPLWAQANPTGNCLAIANTQLAPLDEVDTDLALAR